MNITVNSSMFEVFLNFLLISIGLDAAWCGYRFLKTDDITRIPRLFGYLVLKLFETGIKKDKSNNKIGMIVFNMKAAGVYLLLGGPLLIVDRLFALLIQFLR